MFARGKRVSLHIAEETPWLLRHGVAVSFKTGLPARRLAWQHFVIGAATYAFIPKIFWVEVTHVLLARAVPCLQLCVPFSQLIGPSNR